MKRRATLLGSATAGAMGATPVAVTQPEPLRVRIAVTDDSRCRVSVGMAVFLLPDEQPAMVAALGGMPDKAQPVTISVEGKPRSPYRYIGSVLFLLQSAGFTTASVVADAPSG